MTDKHMHSLAATKMMGVLDYETFNIGCHTCGTQWVFTVNWVDQQFVLTWANVPWQISWDRERQELNVNTTYEHE